MRVSAAATMATVLVSAGVEVQAQMTQQYRDAIITTHNDAKRDESRWARDNPSYGQGESAANMEYEYDLKLEAVAQAYLNNYSGSRFNHNDNRQAEYAAQGGSGYIGENWYSGGPETSVFAWCFRKWSGCTEKEGYYGMNGCSGGDGHYTQVLWDRSFRVGCGYTQTWGTLCNYSPGGNFNGKDFFTTEGPECSACPSSHPLCNDGLCSAGDPCPQNGVWPETLPGKTASLPCADPTYVGQRTRACVTGVWGSVVTQCFPPGDDCDATGDWPATAHTATATIDCGQGMQGTRSRVCVDNGWEAVDLSGCTAVPTTCPCTQNPAFPCRLSGSCYSHSTKASCEGAGGVFCKGGTTDACSAVDCGVSCGVSGLKGDYCRDGAACTNDQCQGSAPTTCSANAGWPTTAIGQTATQACPSGQSGQKTRACNANGNWGSVNNNCVTAITPCPMDSGFPLTQPGATATIQCPSGQTGTKTRVCAASGTWNSINDNCAAAITPCPMDSGFPLTQPGQTAELPCPTGQTGRVTRVCSTGGTWGSANNACVAQAQPCAPDSGFPETPISTTAFIACGEGFNGQQSRRCNSNGSWKAPVTSQCSAVVCSLSLGFPQTAAGQTSTIACATGFSGVQTRMCSAAGVWGAVDDSACVTSQATCAASSPWPVTVAGQTALVECGGGMSGERTRMCNADGSWAAEDDSACQVVCAAVFPWPQTTASTMAVLDCDAGMQGNMTRPCSAQGTWGASIDNCVHIMCSEDGSYSATEAGTTATVQCVEGFTGSWTRECSLTGAWEAQQGGCTQAVCAAEGVWTQTNAGDQATAACADGFVGTLTRQCSVIGVWQAEVNQCQTAAAVQCAAEGEWPLANADQTVSLACGAGKSGDQQRTCGSDGVWMQVQSACADVTCAAEDVWPATTAGQSATTTCGTGNVGTVTRQCGLTGIWGTSVESCTASTTVNSAPAHASRAAAVALTLAVLAVLL